MIHRARWVLPIDGPPLEAGWVESQAGRITRVGQGQPPGQSDDLGDVAILPGLVNSHTHLELSWMAGRVPPAASMHEWITTLLRVRKEGPPDKAAEIDAARKAAGIMHDTGTVLVGDIANSLITPRVLAEAGLGGVVFHELLGFNHTDPTGAVRDAWTRVNAEARRLSAAAVDDTCPIKFAVVAHAPYSVSPALFGAIVAKADQTPLSIHLAESHEELEFLRTGSGPIRHTLESLGLWNASWQVPACDPVTYVADLGYLQHGTLVVHGVHVTDDGLERLRQMGAVIVTCPRSNLWVGVGPPRLAHFFASGVAVAIGTDSLASTPTLNLFDELSELRRLAPEITAATLLDSATRRGAHALGFGRDFGTLAPGKRAAIVSVDVPAGVRDVEEYLVGGVPPDAVRRVA